MRTTHSQIITISDDTRAIVAMLPALVIGLVLVLVLGFGFDPIGSEGTQLGEFPQKLIAIFLVACPRQRKGRSGTTSRSPSSPTSKCERA